MYIISMFAMYQLTLQPVNQSADDPISRKEPKDMIEKEGKNEKKEKKKKEKDEKNIASNVLNFVS
jgi:hypothetical protein